MAVLVVPGIHVLRPESPEERCGCRDKRGRDSGEVGDSIFNGTCSTCRCHPRRHGWTTGACAMDGCCTIPERRCRPLRCLRARALEDRPHGRLSCATPSSFLILPLYAGRPVGVWISYAHVSDKRTRRVYTSACWGYAGDECSGWQIRPQTGNNYTIATEIQEFRYGKWPEICTSP